MTDQIKYTNKLTNKRILIIGGTSGLGYALAEATLEHGAIVTISSSSPSRVSTALSSLQKSYPSAASRITGFPVDLSDPQTLETELDRLFTRTLETTNGERLDHVIYTAGDALSTMPLSSLTYEKIIQAGQLRFFAPLLLAKFILRYVSTSSSSSYTITTGAISEKPMPDWSVIGSYAGGHHAMARNLALDLKPVRVNAVSPGVVDTGLWRLEGEEKEEFLRKAGMGTVTGRVGRVEDVVESFLGVLKDGNVDGSVVRSDGGVMLM